MQAQTAGNTSPHSHPAHIVITRLWSNKNLFLI
ncbi:rCG25507 [Rattus norvegicus]|uniref:RCG25507 n=1 Tax=Rattus norvegicus TaxID=10116 RepID=A6I1P5_RAT|nr:rCG25507 [Rattus norvegicus]